MVYTGIGSYIYFMSEGTKGAANPAVDQNIPFNPMVGLEPPKAKYIDEVVRTFDSLDPKYEFSKELAPGEGPIENFFFDPFFMLTFFTHKTVGGVWGTGTGTIAADFTETDDKETIGIQYKLKDQAASNDIERLLKYGTPQKYGWSFEPGMLLKEIGDVKFNTFADNSQAPTINNNFHDQAFGSGVGGWANWDNTGLGNTGKRSVSDCVIHWGGAVLTGLNIVSGGLEFELPTQTRQIQSSLSHSLDWQGARNFVLNLTGYVNDKTLLAELEQIYDDRSKQTLQFYYDKTASYEKYLQFTNGVLDPENSDIIPIPEAGEAAEVSLVIKGGGSSAASFMGSYKDRPDPTSMITTSP
jgi:hypothetical protein